MSIVPRQLRSAVLAVLVVPFKMGDGSEAKAESLAADAIRRGVASSQLRRYIPATQASSRGAASGKRKGNRKQGRRADRESYAVVIVFEPVALHEPLTKAECEAISPMLTEGTARFRSASVSPAVMAATTDGSAVGVFPQEEYNPNPTTGICDALSIFLSLVAGFRRDKVYLYGLIASMECAFAEAVSDGHAPLHSSRRRRNEYVPSGQKAWGSSRESPASRSNLSADYSVDETVLRATAAFLRAVDMLSGVSHDMYQEFRRRSRQSLKGASFEKEADAEDVADEPNLQTTGLFPSLEAGK